MSASTQPEIAVLMPAYNPSRDELMFSLSSMVDQGAAFHLYIVDDGSKVPVSTLIPETDVPYTVLRLAQNQGIVGALNHGLQHILDQPHFKFIARLDVADAMMPGRLIKQMEYMKARPKLGLCGTDTRCIHEDGSFHSDWQPGEDDQTLRNALTYTNPLTHSAIMIRREVFETLGLYRSEHAAAEDYELICRVARHFEIGNIPEFLTIYVMQPQGISLSNPQRQLRGRLSVQRKYISLISPRQLLGYLRTLLMLSLPFPLVNRIKLAIRGYI